MQGAHSCEPVDNLARMDGLCKNLEFMSPFMSVFQHVRRAVVPGYEKHFAVGKNPADFNSRINPGHAIHYNVADEHIECDGVCSVDGLIATVLGRGIKPKNLKDFSQRISYELFIIDNKDTHLAGRT